LRSGRPGWCRKNPPFSEVPCPVILKSTISYPTFLSSSPCRRHTKNTLFPILWEDETNVQKCMHMVKWGVQRVVSEPPQAPGYYTLLQKYYLFTAQWSLYVQPDLTFTNSTFCPHSLFMCFVWILEQTAIISLYSINWLVFITESECVYCAVRTRSL